MCGGGGGGEVLEMGKGLIYLDASAVRKSY